MRSLALRLPASDEVGLEQVRQQFPTAACICRSRPGHQQDVSVECLRCMADVKAGVCEIRYLNEHSAQIVPAGQGGFYSKDIELY